MISIYISIRWFDTSLIINVADDKDDLIVSTMYVSAVKANAKMTAASIRPIKRDAQNLIKSIEASMITYFWAQMKQFWNQSNVMSNHYKISFQELIEYHWDFSCWDFVIRGLSDNGHCFKENDVNKK